MTDHEDILQTLVEVQDHLVPMLDTYEQALYHYILRHTLLVGKTSALISIKNAHIGLGKSKAGSLPSERQKSKKLRALVQKGCVEVLQRNHRGTEVRSILPSEMPELIQHAQDAPPVDIDEIDFYDGRRYVAPLLEREGFKCFYTLQSIDIDNCVLDHVIPVSRGGDNSYRNIVASSYDANSAKGDKNAEDFARELYRDGLLNLPEMRDLLARIADLQAGRLVPIV